MTHIVSMLIFRHAQPRPPVTFAPKNFANPHRLQLTREFGLDFIHRNNEKFWPAIEIKRNSLTNEQDVL